MRRLEWSHFVCQPQSLRLWDDRNGFDGGELSWMRMEWSLQPFRRYLSYLVSKIGLISICAERFAGSCSYDREKFS